VEEVTMREDEQAQTTRAGAGLSVETRAGLMEMILSDAWLRGRWQLVARDRSRPLGLLILPFWIDQIPRPSGAWSAKGIGLLRLPPAGSPWPPVGLPTLSRDEARGFLAVQPESDAREYRVAMWLDAKPVLVQVWEMRLEREGEPMAARVWWRPGNSDLVVEVPADRGAGSPSRLGRQARAAFQADVWSFLEEPVTRSRPRRKPVEVRDALYDALRRYRQAHGEYPSNVAEELCALVIPPISRDTVLDWLKLLRSHKIAFPPPD
jgi:hypothetical protein